MYSAKLYKIISCASLQKNYSKYSLKRCHFRHVLNSLKLFSYFSFLYDKTHLKKVFSFTFLAVQNESINTFSTDKTVWILCINHIINELCIVFFCIVNYYLQVKCSDRKFIYRSLRMSLIIRTWRRYCWQHAFPLSHGSKTSVINASQLGYYVNVNV